MSRIYLIKFPFFLLLILFFGACTRTLTFQIIEAAEVTLPQNINQVAIVNRALPSKSKSNLLEGVITGELPGQDKQGRQKVLMGVFETLKNTPGYQSILAQDELKGNESGTEFPQAFTAKEVLDLCNKYKVDALVVMEHYDSDCIPGSANLKKEKITNKDGSVTEKVYYEVITIGNVRAGFRIYDKQGKILDQFELKRNISWATTGSTIIEAVGSTLARVDYTNSLSQQLGNQYAYHIAPYWITVSREFYKKGRNQKLKIGGRYISTNDWENAEKMYLDVISQTGGIGKDAAKAYYNLGLCYEYKGELAKAKECLSKSYAISGKSLALEYSNILNYRINNEQRVEQQVHSGQ